MYPSGLLVRRGDFAPDTLGPDKLYRDSTYRRVIKEGTAGLNCYFSYPQGGWQIRKDYGGKQENWRSWINSCAPRLPIR